MVDQALEKGALHVVTSNKDYAGNDKVTVVDDTLKALQDLASYHRNQLGLPIVGITGTNGKTTTSGLIAQILEANGKSVIHNAQGANMLTCIANVFSRTVVPSKRYDNCVLESDEAYLSKLYDYMTLDYLVVTNLFRDQLDRYGELDTTAKKIQSAIDKNKKR